MPNQSSESNINTSGIYDGKSRDKSFSQLECSVDHPQSFICGPSWTLFTADPDPKHTCSDTTVLWQSAKQYFKAEKIPGTFFQIHSDSFKKDDFIQCL